MKDFRQLVTEVRKKKPLSSDSYKKSISNNVKKSKSLLDDVEKLSKKSDDPDLLDFFNVLVSVIKTKTENSIKLSKNKNFDTRKLSGGLDFNDVKSRR